MDYSYRLLAVDDEPDILRTETIRGDGYQLQPKQKVRNIL